MTQNIGNSSSTKKVMQDNVENLKNLIKEGKQMVLDQHYPEAKEIFEIVYKFAPESKVAQSWLFFSSIFVDDAKRAYDLFGILFDNATDLQKKNLRYYLFLMDEVFGYTPPEYKDIFKEAFLMENIVLPYDDKTPKEIIDKLNMIRQRVTIRSYPYAIHLLGEIKANRESPRTSDILEERFLTKAAEKASERRNDYVEFIKNNDFDEFVHLLSDRIANHTASPLEEYLFKLYNHYMNVKNGIIPEIKTDNQEDLPKAKDLFEAIDDNDFINAIEFNREFARSKNFYNILDNPMLLLLNKIVIEMIGLSMKSNTAGIDTLNLIDSYLASIEKSKYKNLIKQLIIIGIQKKDMSSVIDTLNKIASDEYIDSVDFAISGFESSVFNKNIISARAYMNIISSYSDPNERLSDLLSTLEQTNPEKAAFARMYEKLFNNRGAIVFDLSQVKDKNAFIAEAKKHKDVQISSINAENQIVSKYQAEQFPENVIALLDRKTKYADAIEKREDCIEKGIQLVEHSKRVDPFIYLCLGVSYFGLRKYDLAMNYLKIYLSYPKNTAILRERAELLVKFIEQGNNKTAGNQIGKTNNNPASLKKVNG